MSIINRNNEYGLYRPKNCYDTNYHLINLSNSKDHLIDICDVADYKECENEGLNIEEYEEYLDWNILKELSDIDLILESVWKIK